MPLPGERPRTKILIHYLVPRDGGGYEFACRPGEPAVTSDLDRATGEPWACRCNACKGTDAFKANDRPRPNQRGKAADEPIDGCCD